MNTSQSSKKNRSSISKSKKNIFKRLARRQRKKSLHKLCSIFKSNESTSKLDDSVILVTEGADVTPPVKRSRYDQITLSSCSSSDEEIELTTPSPPTNLTLNKRPNLFHSSTPKNAKTRKYINNNSIVKNVTSDVNIDLTEDTSAENHTQSNFVTVCESEDVTNSTTSENTNCKEDSYYNKDSTFFTVDLTLGDQSGSMCEKTVVEDKKVVEADTVSLEDSALSMTNTDSDITVVAATSAPSAKKRKLDNITKKIETLNSREKAKLLNTICAKIFSGCDVSRVVSLTSTHVRPPQTEEDLFIQNVILKSNSRNSVGSNIYNPVRDKARTGLRLVVIDGSNVAMEHSKGAIFSVRGLKIAIDYFLTRGHRVKAFVPRFRCKRGKSSDPQLLDSLERQGLVVYTPSREVMGRNICSYDDRYIVQCACEFDGVIVTGDNYRDLAGESDRWRKFIENRLLPFTWVDDMIMFPRDPLGRTGPTLEKFLRHDTPINTSTIVIS